MRRALPWKRAKWFKPQKSVEKGKRGLSPYTESRWMSGSPLLLLSSSKLARQTEGICGAMASHTCPPVEWTFLHTGVTAYIYGDNPVSRLDPGANGPSYRYEVVTRKEVCPDIELSPHVDWGQKTNLSVEREKSPKGRVVSRQWVCWTSSLWDKLTTVVLLAIEESTCP